MVTAVEIIRQRLGDSDGELYTDDEITAMLASAVAAYSAARPIKRRWMKPSGITEITLPEDYREWIIGLDDCIILENTLYCTPWAREVIYYANWTVDEIPAGDLPLLADYCFCMALESAVSDSGDISSLKLGKGLQLSFDNIAEVRKLASDIKQQVMSRLNSIIGVWC